MKDLQGISTNREEDNQNGKTQDICKKIEYQREHAVKKMGRIRDEMVSGP